MNYSICYSSQTGNTALLAQAIRETLPAEDCLWFGGPETGAIKDSKSCAADGADLIFIGFWTDKGFCDEKAAMFLQSLRGKNVFLFGTAGFGEGQSYFDQILSRVRQNLDASNTVSGTYMCQGKMPISVRKRYEGMLAHNPGDEKTQNLLLNFDSALRHPDESDLERLKETVRRLI